MEDIIIKYLPLIGSFVGGAFLTPFLGEFIKERFAERARKFRHRLNVAKHVLELCNEASASLYEIPPHDQEHVNSTLNNVLGINNAPHVALNRMITLWRLISGFATRKNNTVDDINFVIEMRNEADIKREELISWGNKIRN